jgi:hemolysin III
MEKRDFINYKFREDGFTNYFKKDLYFSNFLGGLARNGIDTKEAANAVTAGTSLLLCILGFGFLLFSALHKGSSVYFFSFLLYGLSAVGVFSASTLLHSTMALKISKKKFEIFDYCVIYLHIAGAYTPLIMFSFNGADCIKLLALVWLMAISGFLYKYFCFDRFPTVSNLSYFFNGWIVIFFLGPVIDLIGIYGVYWLFASGICAAIGFIFFNFDKIPYHHAIWHLFVLGASFCYYVTLTRFIAPL